MKKQQFIYIVCLAALVSGCNIYKPYSRPEMDTKGLYRDPVSATDTLVSDTTNMGDLPWREVFTDPQLQSLIQLGLEQNTDLQTAILKVQEAEAGLMSARLAYTPSLNLAPQGGLSWYENHRRTWTWSAPIAASWEIDIFGKLLNAKRGAKAAVLQSQAYKQAVQTQVIAAVANYYYTLLMLDEQLAITENTSVLWKKTVETMRAMKEAGMVNEAAIVQSEANSYMIEASIPELKQQIREIENALSLILKEAPQQIERGSLKSQSFPAMMNAGVPVQLLSNRPDVKAAEMAFAGTFYNTNAARSAFYPSLSISGNFGWTNQLGSIVANPGKMIAASLQQRRQYGPAADRKGPAAGSAAEFPAGNPECRQRGQQRAVPVPVGRRQNRSAEKTDQFPGKIGRIYAGIINFRNFHLPGSAYGAAIAPQRSAVERIRPVRSHTGHRQPVQRIGRRTQRITIKTQRYDQSISSCRPQCENREERDRLPVRIHR